MTIQTDDFQPARVVSRERASPQEDHIERALRPTSISEYVGQSKIRDQLDIFIQAAKGRSEALDHVLLYGPSLV